MKNSKFTNIEYVWCISHQTLGAVSFPPRPWFSPPQNFSPLSHRCLTAGLQPGARIAASTSSGQTAAPPHVPGIDELSHGRAAQQGRPALPRTMCTTLAGAALRQAPTPAAALPRQWLRHRRTLLTC